MSFCAICTASPAPHREPLGKRGALVAVCDACQTETPVARDRDHNYNPECAPLSAKDLTASMRRVMGDAAYDEESERNQKFGKTPAHALNKNKRMDAQRRVDVAVRTRSGANKHRTVRSSRERKIY